MQVISIMSLEGNKQSVSKYAEEIKQVQSKKGLNILFEEDMINQIEGQREVRQKQGELDCNL